MCAWVWGLFSFKRKVLLLDWFHSDFDLKGWRKLLLWSWLPTVATLRLGWGRKAAEQNKGWKNLRINPILIGWLHDIWNRKSNGRPAFVLSSNYIFIRCIHLRTDFLQTGFCSQASLNAFICWIQQVIVSCFLISSSISLSLPFLLHIVLSFSVLAISNKYIET